MPRAVVNANDTEHHDLKSLPEAYVVLRRMSYDAYLQRRDMTTQIKLMGRGKGKRGGDDDFAGQLAMMSRKVAQIDFQECVVEHNLEDEDGTLLDFSKSSTFRKLDPRVGQEIGDLIDEMNQFLNDEEEQGN